jgi:hypothetical protein
VDDSVPRAQLFLLLGHRLCTDRPVVLIDIHHLLCLVRNLSKECTTAFSGREDHIRKQTYTHDDKESKQSTCQGGSQEAAAAKL